MLSDGELVTLVLTPLAMQQRLVIGVDADDEIDTTGLMATGADAKHSVRVPGNAGVIVRRQHGVEVAEGLACRPLRQMLPTPSWPCCMKVCAHAADQHEPASTRDAHAGVSANCWTSDVRAWA